MHKPWYSPVAGAKNYLTQVEREVYRLEMQSYTLHPSSEVKDDVDFLRRAVAGDISQMDETDKEYAANVVSWEAVSRLRRKYVSPSWTVPESKQERLARFKESPDYSFNYFAKFAFADLMADLFTRSGINFLWVHSSSDFDNCFGWVHLFVELKKDEVFWLRIVPSDFQESFLKTNMNSTAYPGEFNRVKNLGEKSHPMLELYLPVKMIHSFLSEYFESVTTFDGTNKDDRTKVIPEGFTLFEGIASSSRMTQNLIARMKAQVEELTI